MIKLIAFDWNGTLIADTKAVFKSANIALEHFGYSKISIKRYRETYIIPIKDFWLANGGKLEDMSEQHRIFSLYYEKLLKFASLRPNAKKILSSLQSQGIRSLIYSNHTFKDIHRQLELFRLSPYIEVVLARPDKNDQTHLHRRQKEEKLADFIKRQKLNPQEVVSVGDTCEEIEIGHSLGLHTISISGGENSSEKLRRTKPDFLIRNLNQLPLIIKKFNKTDGLTRSNTKRKFAGLIAKL
jgi:phosphoglycolate phosphatase